MANKKCPKCGEDNPAEAVMCWACYTPLTAGAGATMGAGAGLGGGGTATLPRTAVGVPGAETKEKKEIDPKLFFVGGGLLLAAVIALFTTGAIPLGGSSTDVLPPPVDGGGTSGGFVPSPGGQTPPNITPPSGGNGGNIGGGDTSLPTGPPPPSFTTLSAPNPKFNTASFGIAASQPISTPDQAVQLARTARQQMTSSGRWKNTQILVFASPEAGQSFRQFMNSRRGEPLGSGDIASLASQGVWSSAVIFYQSQGNSEKVSQPGKR